MDKALHQVLWDEVANLQQRKSYLSKIKPEALKLR